MQEELVLEDELSESDLALWNSEQSSQITRVLWNDLTVRQQKAHHLIPEKMLNRLVIQRIKYSLDIDSHITYDEANAAIAFRNLLPESPLNDVQKQITLAEQRWGVDAATYLDSLKHLSKLRRHTAERYNIILYALFLHTTTINYKWIEKEFRAISLQRISRKPRSIYMTTDNCIPTSIYKNGNNQRYVSWQPQDLHKINRGNSKAKREFQKFINFQNGESRKQYKVVNGQKTEVTSIPIEMPIIPDSIETHNVIFAPSRELIAFAWQLIQDYSKENDIPCSDRQPIAQGLSHEEMVAAELLKKEMAADQRVQEKISQDIDQWAKENLRPHDRVSPELTCKCSSRLTCTCQSLRGPYAAEDKSSDTE